MRLQEFISKARHQLEKASIQCADPKLHSQQIVEAYFGWRNGESFLKDDSEISSFDIENLNIWLSRRISGEPFQYIVGYEWFWKSKFYVGPGVLIPRRETEHLVEAVLDEAGDVLNVAELGAGSGNIGISILLEKPLWRWTAFEKNPESIPYLRKNLELLPWGSEYLFQQEDFFVAAPRSKPYDLVVANPPYVAKVDIDFLSPEVRREPTLALDGGETGVELPLRLIDESAKLLRPGGKLFLEIGLGQHEAIENRMNLVGFEDVSFIKDYSGILRVGRGTWNGRISH